MSKQAASVSCSDCLRPIRKDNIARHKKWYCSGFVSKSVPPHPVPPVSGAAQIVPVNCGFVQLVDQSTPITTSTDVTGAMSASLPIDSSCASLEEYLFQEPPEKDISDASVCLLRLHYAYDRPQLMTYLARKFPNIP